MSADLRWGDLLVPGDARRAEVRERHGNGLDGVEVRKEGTRLVVYFLDRAPAGLTAGNMRIDGPAGSLAVRAVEVRRSADLDSELEDRLLVDLDRAGSAGRYRLRIVESEPDGRPGRAVYRGIDPRFADVWFVFDVDAPSPPIARTAPADAPSAYDVSYLGRDYEGLRQLMLDRLGVTVPDWTERHAADVLVTLVELLAYAGDDLSYYADAVATESYLQTARRRVSIRRHARLVDYRVHDGCTARAWVCVACKEPFTLPLRAVRFAAAWPQPEGRPPVIDATSTDPRKLATLRQYTPLPAGATLSLQPAHNAIALYAWGETDSRLALGATRAVLVDDERTLRLSPGDVLVLEETVDPETRGAGLPDPRHRQAVRLTAVRPLFDELYSQPLVEVWWDVEDALRFELTVTAGGLVCSQACANVVLVTHGVSAEETLDGSAERRLSRSQLSFATSFPDPALVARHQARRLRGLYRRWRAELERSYADALRGTPLPAQQLEGLREQLGDREFEEVGLLRASEYGDDNPAKDACGLAELLARADRLLAGRRRRAEVLARLAEASGPLDEVLVSELDADWGSALAAGLAPAHPGAWGPAAGALAQDPLAALPVLELTRGSRTWLPALDLIDVADSARAVVAEVDDEGFASLRLSAPPPDGTKLAATYRVGNGTHGNALANAINAIVWVGGEAGAGVARNLLDAIGTVRNPLPATGGVDPQDAATAKLAIPGAFLDDQPRALTAADYAARASKQTGVRRAAAELRFTGALTVVDVALQPGEGEEPHPDLLAAVQHKLESVRRIGHVVRVGAPRYRPLVVALQVQLAPSAVRARIADAFAELLSSGWRTDGEPALFHPARLEFGAPVYASALIAAAHALDGVQSAILTSFGFAGDAPPGPGWTAPEALTFDPLELPRLDNDPAAPQHGYAAVSLEGGR